MGFLDRLFGDDHERATKYEGRESASDRAARKRREGHRRAVVRDGDNSGIKFSRRTRRDAF